LTDGTWTYTWQNGRELAAMTDGTTTWTYTYDANGMRTQRSNGTTAYNYVYNGSTLGQMAVGSNTLNFAYDASGLPMVVDYNGTSYYYLTNLQGDVTGITDSTGTLVVSYTYDAWGKPLSITGSMADTLGVLNPLRYRGYVYDTETGLYYLQSRYYNPEIGRFINVDSFVATGQGLLGYNMFAYCGNNPISRYDPTGKRYCEVSVELTGGRTSTNITSDGLGRSDELLALCTTELGQLNRNQDFSLSVESLGNIMKQTDRSVEQAQSLLLLVAEALAGKAVAMCSSRIVKALYGFITTGFDIAHIIDMGDSFEEFPDGYYDTYKVAVSWTEAYSWGTGTTYSYYSYEFLVCWDVVSSATPQWRTASATNNTQTVVVYH